ncbi:MAG: hypothetical protein CVU61_14285 [Deltaproteobacteria bacterium HGW-Deltaproteobacteria-19]|jgi:general secretion pathway protein L|nr:MAG: hypothetical protein CVU61_14285 [Deltaproteobacteria bacterium HGW-Deltaproteobacteria-19]
MTTAEMLNRTTSLASGIADRVLRWFGILWRALTFSLADERVAPLRSVAILLEEGGMSVVYASRFLSRIRLRGVRRYAFEPGRYPTPENVAASILLAVNELNAAGTPISLVIPKAWCIIRKIEFPPAVRENLPDVVTFELDRLTPLPAEQALYDFQALESGEGPVRIMLAAVREDMVQPYLAALRKRGVTVDRVTVHVSALGTLGHFLHRSGNTVFVGIRAGAYEGGWVRDGRWEDSFAGNLPARDGEAAVGVLADAVQAVLDRVPASGGPPPRVYVYAEAEAEAWSGLRDLIQAPVRYIRDSDLAPLLLPAGKGVDIPHVALGGALESLWPGAEGMNLLSRGVHNPRKAPLAVTMVLLAVLTAVGILWLVSPLQFVEWKIEAVDREIASRRGEIAKIEVLKRDVEGVEKQIAAIGAFKANHPMRLILIREITTVLPKTAWLSRLRIMDNNVEIEGYASTATEILPKFEVSPHFRKVEFAAPTSRDTRLNMDRFSIKMEIESLAGGKARDAQKE